MLRINVIRQKLNFLFYIRFEFTYFTYFLNFIFQNLVQTLLEGRKYSLIEEAPST